MIKAADSFRAQEWRLLSPSFRLEELQDFENALASEEHREPNLIGGIFGAELNQDGSPVLRGSHYTDEKGLGHIDISAELLRDDRPYQAVETYLHEARHSYQDAVVKDPQIHNDAEQAKAWAQNRLETESYIRPEEDFVYYRGQAVEADANLTARERTDEIYQGQFADQSGYDEFKKQKLREVASFKEQAQIKLGPDYQKVIDEEVVDRYKAYEKKLEQEKANEQEFDYGL